MNAKSLLPRKKKAARIFFIFRCSSPSRLFFCLLRSLFLRAIFAGAPQKLPFLCLPGGRESERSRSQSVWRAKLNSKWALRGKKCRREILIGAGKGSDFLT